MQALLYTEKNQRGHRQNHLQALHSLLVETQWFLAPLGSRTVAKTANMYKNSQTQRGTEEGDCHHRNTNPVDMNPVHRCCCPRTQGKGAYSEHDSEAIDSHEGSAYALEQCKEET